MVDKSGNNCKISKCSDSTYLQNRQNSSFILPIFLMFCISQTFEKIIKARLEKSKSKPKTQWGLKRDGGATGALSQLIIHI